MKPEDEKNEYEYSEGTQPESLSESPMYTTQKPKKSMLKKVLILVVLTLLVFGALKMMNLRSSDQLTPVAQTTSSAQTQADAEKMREAQIASANALAAQQKKQAASELSASVSNMESQLKTDSANMDAIQKNTDALQDSLNTLTQQIQGLTGQVKNLTGAVQTLKKNQNIIASKIFANEPKHANTYVAGMIDGRAWIFTPGKGLFSVANGDDIPDYGKVVSIDTDRGIVKTSKGKTITYGVGLN